MEEAKQGIQSAGLGLSSGGSHSSHGGSQPSQESSRSLCPLTNGWSVAGHLVLHVEGILVSRGLVVRDGAEVLHGEAAQPSGQCTLTLQGRGALHHLLEGQAPSRKWP